VGAAATTRTAAVAVAAVGAALGAGAFALVVTSDHLLHPVAYAIELVEVVIASAAVGAYWLVKRPGNRTALLLFIAAGFTLGLSLQGASSPLLHSIGVLCDAPFFVLGYWIVFVFPEGRLSTLADRVLVAGTAGLLLISFVPWFFFSPYVSGGAPLAGCNADCPRNALMLADRPSIANAFGKTERYIAVAYAIVVLAVLVQRQVTASRPRKRALLPVYVPAVMLTVAFGVFQAAGAGLVTLDAQASWRIGWLVTAARMVAPLGFLLAILQSALFAATALKAIVGRLGIEPNAAELRTTIAEALDDPSLELAFAADTDRSLVDSRRAPITAEALASHRSVSTVTREGRVVAYIAHDPTLETDPELVQAAGHAMLLALDNGRLERELRATIAELRASRSRIVAVADAERRKIERDLHDGAQQRLVALLVRLGGARDSAREDSELAQELADLGDEVVGIIDDLRNLAHGIYPPELRDYGLTDGLASITHRSLQPVTLASHGVGRYRPEVEAAVYFCCLEALQNVAKHAGPGATAAIHVRQRDGTLSFEIVDDGVGYEADDPATRGAGLTSMTDRVAAVGGTLDVDSTLGAGTHVRGRIPVNR
jgi:signal transduction histidine kinase